MRSELTSSYSCCELPLMTVWEIGLYCFYMTLTEICSYKMGLVPFITWKYTTHLTDMNYEFVCVYVVKWLFQGSAKTIYMLWASMIIQQRYNRKPSDNFLKCEAQRHNNTAYISILLPKTVTSEINNPELTISLENNLSGYTESINLHNRSGSFVVTLALIYQNKCESTIIRLPWCVILYKYALYYSQQIIQ